MNEITQKNALQETFIKRFWNNRLYRKNINRCATLGIFIGNKKFRNKGYGTKAIQLILEYDFKYLNFHSIKLDLISGNEMAHKCYLKCGFKDVGCSREQIFLNGKYYNKLHMDILENEFKGSYIKNKNIV